MINTLHLCGPFLSASNAIDRFGSNVYQATALAEAIEMYTKYEDKIKDAMKEEKDPAYIVSLQEESAYYEQIFNISLASFCSADEV